MIKIDFDFLHPINKNSLTQISQKTNYLRGLSRYLIPFVSKRDSSYYTDKDKVVSITYEEIGLFPRSFSRVLDRFLKQLFSDVDNLVIQEYRFYRYLFLTTIKTIFILFFVPFLVNFAAKNYVVKPITEYFWNTSHPEIFLNSYEQKRAFAELEKFEEKIYFETLVEAHSQPFQVSKLSTKLGLIEKNNLPQINFLPPEEGYAEKSNENMLPQTNVSNNSLMPAPLTNYSLKTIHNTSSFSQQNDSGLSSTKLGFVEKTSHDGKFIFALPMQNLDINIMQDALLKDRVKNKKDFLQYSSDSIQRIDAIPFRGSLLLDPVCIPEGDAVTSIFHGPKGLIYPFMGLDNLDNASTNNHLLNLATITDYRTFSNNSEIDTNYYFGDKYIPRKDIKNINLNSLIILPEERKNISERDFQKLTYLDKQIPIEYKSNIIRKHKDISKIYQEKTIELATYYNNHSIEAITNFFADLLSLCTLLYLLITLEIQINITKSFLLEVFFGLDDSKKSLLILLITDLLVGYHSSNLWELFFEFIFNHYGIPESQTGIFLLVATLPVLLDVLFKYLIFRHLNRSSPATVATYQAIIE
uniref:Potassium/proton antiporter CemA n=1 Tax=Gonium pectorale TaxID=33097 RepID=M1VMF1_GONPE|nr:envelope membrane protein [Gonium pectorale]BAM85997.1 envelope membrane protein [Gonium pectorale]